MAEENDTNIELGTDALEKGIVRGDKQLIAWDCVQGCDPSECPIGETCVYAMKDRDGRCALQINYLQALTNTLFSTYRYLGDEELFKIGMHIVPLYSMLCRQKIVEKALTSLTYHDAKGNIKIHPIYKEIRETMKVITLMWKEMGFVKTPDMGGALPGAPAQTGHGTFGDPSHYNNISQTTDRRGVIR